jgi:gliding motility-associated-like protein
LKTFTRIIAIAIACCAARAVQAQVLEFVENKGQWDKQVQFKGDLIYGAFLLQKNGYRVVLHNPKDMRHIAAFFGGHADEEATGNSAGGTTPTGGGGGGKPEQASEAARQVKTGTGSNNAQTFVLRSHAYQASFLHASDEVIALPDKPLNTYNNYFIDNDSTKWATGCRVFQAVTYKNMYPNIDVRYFSENGMLKYDIIVHPGGDASKIALQFDGVDKLDTKEENLRIQTTVGEVSELKPYTYQASDNGKQEIKARYVIRNNTVTFKLDNYDKNRTLIIDPTEVFSTLTGSTADNWGFTATYDNQGNFYAGGIVFGARGNFPVSNGAFQTSFQGGDGMDNGSPCDIGIIKFNPNGTSRVYATYIGGNGNEQPHSLVVDSRGNLVIAGRTTSTNFPTTADNFGPCGSYDIFIAKLNPTGTSLIGSRKIGGSGMDGVNIQPKYASGGSSNGSTISTRRNYGDDARSEVIVDYSNNIYLAAQTQSGNFPVTPGAFQPTFGGSQDGVLIKASPDMNTISFSSFLGGSGNDAAFVLSLNPANNNIYVAGGTSSRDFPGTGNGAVLFSSYQGGDCDGFVAIVSNDGSSLIKSSYFGTSGADLVFGIQFDNLSFPYIMGTTTGTWPVTSNVAFKQANGKQFISKLQSDLSAWVYSTVFGKGAAKPDISPTAFLVDRCENVYVSGWGGGIDIGFGYDNSGTNGLTTTPDALIPASPSRDNADFYFFVLKKDAAAQLYGSMFGQNGGLGDHVDGGTSRFDKQGVIYQSICANCNSAGISFPTTAGAWSSRNGAAPGCNLAAVKIAFELAGVHAGLRASIEGVPNDTTGCIPLTVDFADTLALAKTYIWHFADGSPDTTTLVPNVSHTFTDVGDYRVRLVVIDSSSCNITDTSYIHIRARKDKAVLSFVNSKLPPCDSLKYQFENTSAAPSTKPFTSQSFEWNFGDGTGSGATGTQSYTHSYASIGIYNVVLKLLDTSYCNYPDSVVKTVRISPNVKAQFETPAAGCFPYTAEFRNTSLAGQQFIWDFGDGHTSQETDPSHTYTQTGTYTIKLIAIDSSTCNRIDSTSKTILVSPRPAAAFSYNPVQPQENTPTTFINTSTGATAYLWHFGDGDTLKTISRDTTVQHIYNVTGTFDPCLFVTNDYGCADSVCQAVRAIVVPLVDVPNAFTPNGDGINDVIRVRGYGIAKLNFRIYNRWGTLVYQSAGSKTNTGWDGRYNGVLQPQDVYMYIADIEFTDGTKYQKKGDITLLR